MKSYHPTTPSRRHMTTITYKGVLTRGEPHKALTRGGKRHVGRNADGRITVRHKGAGHKRLYRELDFMYNKYDMPATLESVEYDPNRSGFIGVALYRDGERRYVLVPQSMKAGGTFIYNIELKPKGGAKLVRSAGSFAEVLGIHAGSVNVKLPSSEVRRISENAWASVGAVSNEEYKLVNIGKAGRPRWMGIRPTVRESPMNRVDRPYGGGEAGQGRGTRRAKSAWGKPTGKGQKTRRPKKYSNVHIVSRRKVGKRS